MLALLPHLGQRPTGEECTSIEKHQKEYGATCPARIATLPPPAISQEEVSGHFLKCGWCPMDSANRDLYEARNRVFTLAHFADFPPYFFELFSSLLSGTSWTGLRTTDLIAICLRGGGLRWPVRILSFQPVRDLLMPPSFKVSISENYVSARANEVREWKSMRLHDFLGELAR
jgi:hypothetical protein